MPWRSSGHPWTRCTRCAAAPCSTTRAAPANGRDHVIELCPAGPDVFRGKEHPAPGACPVLLLRKLDSAAKLCSAVLPPDAAEGSSRLGDVAVNLVAHETGGYGKPARLQKYLDGQCLSSGAAFAVAGVVMAPGGLAEGWLGSRDRCAGSEGAEPIAVVSGVVYSQERVRAGGGNDDRHTSWHSARRTDNMGFLIPSRYDT
jgi:hypothetical protein